MDKRVVSLSAGIQYEFLLTADTVDPFSMLAHNPVLIYEVIKR